RSLLPRHLRAAPARSEHGLRRRGDGPADALVERDELLDGAGPVLDVGGERRRPAPDGRSVPARQAGGAAGTARPGFAPAAALLSPLRVAGARAAARPRCAGSHRAGRRAGVARPAALGGAGIPAPLGAGPRRTGPNPGPSRGPARPVTVAGRSPSERSLQW